MLFRTLCCACSLQALRVLILSPSIGSRLTTTDSNKSVAPESHGDCLEDANTVMGLLAIEESIQMMVCPLG